MKTLLIDDLREIKADRVARNFDDGLAALKEGGWDLLLLDHDLASYGADGKEKTGYDIICWIEANPEMKPGHIQIVSANPVGRQKMEVVIKKLYES